MRILLDTNVLLSLVESSHVQHQVIVDAIEVLRSGGHDLLIAPQVLYEDKDSARPPGQ